MTSKEREASSKVSLLGWQDVSRPSVRGTGKQLNPGICFVGRGSYCNEK